MTSHWFWPRLVSVMINRDGKYDAPVYYSIQKSSREVRVADLDGDGFGDIIAANTDPAGRERRCRFSSTKETARAPRTDYPAVIGPAGIAAPTSTATATTDLVVARYDHLGSGDEVALLTNDGAGGLASPVTFPAAPSPYRVIAGDLDGDGLPDVVAACENTLVAVLLNTGGAFAPPLEIDAGFGVNDLFRVWRWRFRSRRGPGHLLRKHALATRLRRVCRGHDREPGRRFVRISELCADRGGSRRSGRDRGRRRHRRRLGWTS